MSYLVYKIIHLLGIFLVLVSLGGVSIHATNPGARHEPIIRMLLMGMHGFGLFIILLGGFGMLARLGITQDFAFPGWVWPKLIIWVLLGAAAYFPYRRASLARPLLGIVPLLGFIAAYMALIKPL